MRLVCLLFAVCFLLSCRDEFEVFPVAAEENAGEILAQKGVVRVKLSESTARSLTVDESRGVVETGDAAWDAVARSLGAYRMKRAFPPAGKFEERHRKWGLHLWYDIYFDEEVSTRSACEDLESLTGVEIVEEIFVPHVDYRRVAPLTVPAQIDVPMAVSEGMPFNDPMLPEQWHYHNTGQVVPSVSGADVNLFEAWTYETGSRNVIVAVLDEGVDINHEDLRANIWVNPGEISGDGIDNDGNGYVDDVNGFNFHTMQAYIKPMLHGTHVSGTIAAVNDNGVGVGSIAGGTLYSPGVQIMVCQMLEEKNVTMVGNLFDAFVYAADNGASIAQCSWSYGDWNQYYNQSQITAMDYFIENAGIDVDGNQVGPMAGGLIVFAAANGKEDLPVPFDCYPARYERVIAATAFGPDLKWANYANYGDWVDIAAPGGNFYLTPGLYQSTAAVLSTDVGNSYSWQNGTSMAAPHVSGVAALILSRHQGVGFTVDDLKELLLGSTHPELYDYNPSMEGLLGVGYVDAAMALRPQNSSGPDAVEKIDAVAYNDCAVLKWTVAADEEDGSAFRYQLTWEAVDAVLPGGEKTISVAMKEAGDVVCDTVRGLRLGIMYRFMLTGYDRWGNASEPAMVEKLVEYNAAPEVERLWEGNVFLDETSTFELPFRVTDREGHAWTARLVENLEWVTLTSEGENLELFFAPDYGDATDGVRQMELCVEDEYGAVTKVGFPYEVRRMITVPQLVQQMADMSLENGKEQRVLLEDYFQDAHGDLLVYEVESSDEKVCAARISGNYLVLRGVGGGHSMILVRASNEDNQNVSCRFRVNVSE